MKPQVKIYKVGNSLGFKIPSRIVKSEKIEENQLVEISVKNLGNSKKRITINL